MNHIGISNGVGRSKLLWAVPAAFLMFLAYRPLNVTKLDDLSINNSIAINNERFDVRAYGAKCDNSTDDTSAINSAITAANNANGGTIVFPAATCVIASQITLPNDGGSPPHQKAFRITGSGNHQGLGTPNGGTILKWTANPTTCGKLCTLAQGKLEIDHLTIYDTTASTAPFIYTTNTTLHVHDVGAYGNTNEDFVVLGGQSTVTSGGLYTGAFQGYGTVIEGNFINFMRRLVLFGCFADAVQVTNNSIFQSCAGTAAIDLDGGGVGCVASGNYIAGNYIEDGAYTYAIRVGTSRTSTGNYFVGNMFFDGVLNTTLAHYRFETTGIYNTVIDSNSDLGTIPVVSDASSPTVNTVITSTQSLASTFPGGLQSLSTKWVSNNMTGPGPAIMNFSCITVGGDCYTPIADQAGQITYVTVRNGGNSELQSSSGNLTMIPASGKNWIVNPGNAGQTFAVSGSQGHVIASGTAQSSSNLSSCGTGSPTVSTGSTDTVGKITEGTTATGCTMAFTHTYNTTPFCTCTANQGGVAVACDASGSSPTSLVVVNASATGDVITYNCMGEGVTGQ